MKRAESKLEFITNTSKIRTTGYKKCMLDRLVIDNDTIKIETLLSLLATYKLLPNFKREQAIDRAIANITISPEESNLALQQFQQRYQLNTQEAIQNYCRIYSITDEQLQAIALREYKIEKFMTTSCKRPRRAVRRRVPSLRPFPRHAAGR